MGDCGGSPPDVPRESPPKAIIDTSPIMMDQNKESLKVKLLLRRPFDQLVAQGIMPPHKTPAAYHGQRKQLERAKTGDLLKAKIQQRPPRQELERRHILEADPNHVDPSLAERQRMLKKAKLADQLNDQLSHRPGPLELIQKNILHTEEPIEQAVKTGRIPYKATSEGQLNRPQLPCNYINPEEDSQSSEGDNLVSPGPSDVIEAAAKSAGIVVSLIQPAESAVVVTTSAPLLSKDNGEIVFADLCRSVGAPMLSHVSAASPASLISSTSTLSPLSSAPSPVPSLVSPGTPAPPPPPISLITRSMPSPGSKTDAPGKDKNRKKSKSKSIPKARTIKFHEYKGPPSAQKNSSSNPNSAESSYDLLLKQQTLLLQCQLQLQHKFPQIILPALQKTSPNEISNNHINTPQPSPAPSTSSESSVPTRISGRLEDMKVSDLKAELKRRNLPVSGSKPQLIERLKPFTNSDVVNQNPNSIDSSASVHSNVSIEPPNNSPPYQNINSPPESLNDEKIEHMDLDPSSPTPEKMQEVFQPIKQELKTSEDIVREQQKTIEELQRKLTLSQMKLHAVTRSEAKPQKIALQKHLQAKQQQQQLQLQQDQQQQQVQQNLALHMKQLQALQTQQVQANEEQQRIQQQQHFAFQNQKNMNGVLLNGRDAAIVFHQIMQGKAKILNGHTKSNSLPNFLSNIVAPVIASPEIKNEYIEETKPHLQEVKIEIRDEPKQAPPMYEEATKQMNKKNYIKSQIVDDVLEILIKNGELPPSAANDPATPVSAGVKINEPSFPQFPQNMVVDHHYNSDNVVENNDLNSSESAIGIDPNDLLETLDNLDNMDFSQLVMELGSCQTNPPKSNMANDNVTQCNTEMDTDDWLDSFLPNQNDCNGNNDTSVHLGVNQEADFSYDPLLGIVHENFDPFNLGDFRSPADLTLSWDKIDYAA